MSRQLIIGLAAEGKTDYRFLPNIILRTYEDIAFECTRIPDFLDIVPIKVSREDLITYTSQAAVEAYNSGVEILCLHHDADDRTDEEFRNGALRRALEALTATVQPYCAIVVPIIPIRTIENWLLADKEALRKAIGTDLDLRTLGLQHTAESYGRPKDALRNALELHESQFTGRRRKRTIADLYLPLSRDASLAELRRLPSFEKFYQAARDSLITLNLLHP